MSPAHSANTVSGPIEELVGREEELELLLSSLRTSERAIWYVHGIAGIGKSTLLRAFASAAERNGCFVLLLDGRSTEPTATGFLESVSQHIGRKVTVANLTAALGGKSKAVAIVIDNYESLTLLDPWIRQILVPALPSSARLFLAARELPGPAVAA